jgi:hypothetical protein
VGASAGGVDAKPDKPSISLNTLFEAYPAQRRSQTQRAEPYPRPVVAEEKDPPRPVEIPSTPHEPPRSVEPMIVTEAAETSSKAAERINANIATKKKKTPVSKKKKKSNLQPLISLNVPPYSMVDDIKNQQARITFGQLLEVAPKCRSELIRGIRKPTVRKMNLGEQETGETATALYCDATVKGTEIPLIIDSGAAGSIVSCQLLKDLKIPIDRPSTTMMINVNGERKRPLGEVLDFPITIRGITVPINVIVTEAESYAAIVGNDWLSKVKANIDYESSTMSFTWSKQTIEVPIEYRLMPQEKRKLQGLNDSITQSKEDDDGSEKEDTDEEETDDDSIKEEEEEFEDDEPEERVFFTVQFEKPRRQKPVRNRNDKKRNDVRKQDPLPEFSVVLDCKFDDVVIDAIYPCEDFVLTNDGIYLGERFHTWRYLQYLNQKFEVTPPKKATWVYDWKGPRAKCWCRDSLYSPEDSCYSCQDSLVTYQTVRRLSPAIIAEMSRGRCDDVVPCEEQRKLALANQPYNQLTLEKVAAENDRQLCNHCGQKTHLEYEQITKEVEYYHVEVGPGIETTPATIKMKVGTLPVELELPLLRFLVQRHGSFAWDSSELGRTNLIRHSIDTGKNKAVRKHWYRTSKNERNFIEGEIQRMLQEGLIERSIGPWAAPVVLVRKKNGKLRFCVDYRELNSITTKDAYPLPRIDDMLDSFGKAQWFTSLDLASGYWQVEMEPADRPKTAFITQFGTYQFKVMPFGLCNAPATFQRLMDEVLRGYLWKFVMVYLDDVIIYSDTFEQHLEHLRDIFDRLEEAGLKLNPDKCSFVKEELEFLGHIVSNKGIRTDPAKIQKVKDFPTPMNITQLRGFLGLASYYRRFVPGFSRIATPLNKLLKKGVAYNWNKEQRFAFEQLKHALITSPILIFPNFEKQFVLLTDASTFGLGAILSQLDEDGNDRVIAYASRTCNKAESNYSATELECLAVIWAVKHFHAYIYGQRFKLVTDHAALCHLFNTATPIGRLARWVMKLQMYDFETTHRSGRKHLNVDSLSRIRT